MTDAEYREIQEFALANLNQDGSPGVSVIVDPTLSEDGTPSRLMKRISPEIEGSAVLVNRADFADLRRRMDAAAKDYIGTVL